LHVQQKKKEDKVQNNLNPYVVGFIIFVVVGSGTSRAGARCVVAEARA